jgi:hypothetical protein
VKNQFRPAQTAVMRVRPASKHGILFSEGRLCPNRMITLNWRA